VIVIGDSLAFMMRPHLEPHGIKVLGRGGSNLGQWLKNGWLRQALNDWSPELVCVSLGANDYPVRANRNAFLERATRLVERCTIVGVDVLWLAPPSAATFVAEQARRAGAPVLLPPKMPMSDRVHPSRAGFTIWTSEILRRVS
jgi:lysophospholipase L1-like esterase